MIQRIQSIFLLIGAICMFAAVFLPVWVKMSVDTEGHLIVLNYFKMLHTYQGKEVSNIPTFYNAALAFISASIFIGSLLSYTNRMKQIKLGLINTLIMIIVIALNMYFFWFKGMYYFETMNQGKLEWGFYLPIVAMLMNSIANRFIRRDELLVKSADRLR
ncbi:MAG: DUF4293 domain-containing protein [Flammeovirgaceae bacterium]